MTHKKIASLFLIFLIYNASLSYYTFYGISKSAIEYFCIQKRADNADYTQTFNVGWLMNTKFRSAKIPTFHIATNGRFWKFDPQISMCGPDEYCDAVKPELIPMGDKLLIEYEKGSLYFKISCEITEIQSEKSFEYKVDGMEVLESGHLKDSAYTYLRINGTTLNADKMSCKFQKSPETCAIKKETIDNFFKKYLLMLCALFGYFALLFSNFRSKLVVRKSKSFYDWVFGDGLNFEFCNPITGDPHFFKTGDKCQKIGVQGIGNWPKREHMLRELTDKRGKYTFLTDTELLINTKTTKKLLKLPSINHGKFLMNYFYTITIDPSMCVVNSEADHFLETEEVCNKISSGMVLFETECVKNSCALTVSKFNLDLIQKMFQIKDTVAAKLIEHNQLFFGNLEMAALILCFKSKMYFWNRPSSVNNSQWKWYTSDFCKLANGELNSNYKSQCVWTDSKALKTLRKIVKVEIDESNIDAEVVCENSISSVDCTPLLNFCSRSIIRQTNTSLAEVDLNSLPSNRLGIAVRNAIPIYEDLQKKISKFNIDYEDKKSHNIKQAKELVKERSESLMSVLQNGSLKLSSYKEAICNPERVINKNQASSWRKAVRELEKLDKTIPPQDRATNYNYKKILEKEKMCKEKMQINDPAEWVLPKYKFKTKNVIKSSMVVITNFEKVLNLLNEHDEDNTSNCDKQIVNINLKDFCSYVNDKSKKKTKFYKTSKRKKGNKNRITQKFSGFKKWAICDRLELFRASICKINNKEFRTKIKPKSVHSAASLLMYGIKSGKFVQEKKGAEQQEIPQINGFAKRISDLQTSKISFSDVNDEMLENWLIKTGLHVGFGWIFS